MTANRSSLRTSLVSACTLLLILGVATLADARGGRRLDLVGHGQRGPGFAGPGAGDLAQRLLFPCQSSCFDDARACIGDAESEALSCAQATCTTEIEAAQNACAGDRTNSECRSARSALLECLDPCVEARISAFQACHDDAETCRSACDEGSGE